MKDGMLEDRMAYHLAKNYWLSQDIEGISASLIEKYLNPFSLSPKPTSIEGIYQRMLESAQNSNMKAGVVGRSIGGIGNLSKVLESFNPEAVLNRYADDWEAVLDAIIIDLHPRGEIRKTSRSIWPLYCKTILSAANFLKQFSSSSEFFKWVDFFDQDDRARAGLPMLLSQEIAGFGFALSCDLLKEMGYVHFPKPDVHLRDIFTALGLYQGKPNDYNLFKAIIRLARHAEVSPYNADKVFWLIGSGYFYHDLCLGKQGRVGSRKKEFIEYAIPLLARI